MTRQLHIKTFIEPMFAENGYLVSAADDAGRTVAWVIDPSFSPQVEDLLAHAHSHQMEIEKIVLTHGHADHIGGVDTVKQAYPQAAVLIAAEDAPMLADATLNLSAPFGLDMILESRADADLTPGMCLDLAGFTWCVLDTSGHSPGGRSIYCPQAAAIFTGDALFAEGIGRYDFPGSDGDRLKDNIRRQLFTLPDETVVYSGHGPKTTIGNERKFNPFLSE